MTNIEIINKAESIINDPERPEVLPLEDIGTISAALGIARILTSRTAEYDKAREEGRLVEFKSKVDASYAKAIFEAIENCTTSCICDCRRCSGVHDIAAEAALSERGGEE